MRKAALLVALLAVPAGSQQGAAPADAAVRRAVLQTLPPDVAARGASGDLPSFLSALPPDQRAAAAASLAGGEDGLGSDPATLDQLGGAYLALGSPDRALSTAQRALDQNPADP
ncbi:MAG: tetratricopeptide repeat protein, partial [Elusimicrobia bacterium]|nr:tetratricopeptide repeat protein [Elusimicrobiota bacterium]